ncbi:hypothetical protein [Iodobacter fluviatilis]|uniref:Uncharacterized protein n=1 Tax=Iodobacter fluviatilis TaxID=537 RepID=A0A7G3G837_9NEIS|nr:hypothetical protein [Iodobacter fluviatilis]QBC43324.1 hypothetical protein C1H71_07070 [Iodobacter fluviatilis]
MIHQTMLKAIIVGVSVLVLAQVLYIGVLLRIEHHDVLRILLLFFPCISAFLSACIAPRRKLLIGMSMAIWGSLIAIFSAMIYERMGLPVDSIGGPLATLVVVFTYDAILSILGGAAGYCCSRHQIIETRQSTFH